MFMMLTKRNKIREKLKLKPFLFTFKTCPGVWRRATNNQTLKKIHAIGTKIVDAADGRADDRRRTDFDWMSFANSQAELIIGKKKYGFFFVVQKFKNRPNVWPRGKEVKFERNPRIIGACYSNTAGLRAKLGEI